MSASARDYLMRSNLDRFRRAIAQANYVNPITKMSKVMESYAGLRIAEFIKLVGKRMDEEPGREYFGSDVEELLTEIFEEEI
jgi:vacuolar-type H+-ATPase catalytic subunit A/Vma1